MKMKISKECKEQIKTLLEEFFECNIDDRENANILNVDTFIYYAQYKGYELFNWLVYDRIYRIWGDTKKKCFSINKLLEILHKYYHTNETKKLYNKIITLIAYHNKDYDYLADKITNLLSSL